MTEVLASNLTSREDVFTVVSGDVLIHNGLRVFVKRITVAMGGDVCIEGIVHSYSSTHIYNVFYGDLVFWGPRCLAHNLSDYLAGKGVGKKP